MAVIDLTKDHSHENDRVRLEPLTQAHHPHLLEITLDKPELLQYSPSVNHTEEFLSQYIEAALTQRQEGHRFAYAIYDKKYQAYAGSTSYLNISAKNQRTEIGTTWIDKKYQGTNLNTHMKYLMLCFAFEMLNFRRVEFKADALNVQSRRAMEKIGAQYEGSLRSHTLMSDGRRRDTVYYSILSEEWSEIKQKLEARL